MDPHPWEEDASHIPDTEWSKISSEFTNSGYREGIIAGKEAFLQLGFDAGFADVGVPLGRDLGLLRGVAAAIKSLLIDRDPHLEELRSISSALSAIQFSDIAPRDLEAEHHAREHLASAFDNPTCDQVSVPEETRTTADILKLKQRLAILSAKLGLPVLA